MHNLFSVLTVLVVMVAFAGAAFAAGQPAQQELRDQAFLSSLAPSTAPQVCASIAGPVAPTPLINCTNSFCETQQNCAVCPGGLSAWFCNSNHRCQPF